MKILLTGFEPFLDYGINPTEKLVQKLNGWTTEKFSVIGRVIPLRFKEIGLIIRQLLDEIEPDIVILSGQAARAGLSLERIAINWADSRGNPYNCGTVVAGQKLQEAGADGYFSTLPINELLEHLRDVNIPTHISNSAGTYGCNQIFYETMFALRNTKIPAGFVHVPLLPSQHTEARLPTLDFATLEQGFREIIQFVAQKYF